MTRSYLETDGSNVERNKKIFKNEVALGLKDCIGFQETEEKKGISRR